jgi:hypothetical protein
MGKETRLIVNHSIKPISGHEEEVEVEFLGMREGKKRDFYPELKSTSLSLLQNIQLLCRPQFSLSLSLTSLLCCFYEINN